MTTADSKQRVALVTGSSSGLGKAMAERLRKESFRVIGVGRHQDETCAVEDFIVADLSCPNAANEIALELEKRTDHLDLLVNNAGFGGYATWEELPEQELRRMFEVDFFAPVALTRALLPLLRKGEGEAKGVINLSSVAGIAPVCCMGAYSSVKSAMSAFSRTLQMELKRESIHVLTVYPGRISTGFSDRAIAIRRHPHTPGANVNPADFAQAVWHAYSRRKISLLYPSWYCLFLWYVRHFPASYGKACAKAWKL